MSAVCDCERRVDVLARVASRTGQDEKTKTALTKYMARLWARHEINCPPAAEDEEGSH